MRVKKYAEFILENENINLDEKEENGIVKLPTLKRVIDKDFFAELKEHVEYWFKYDFLNKKYELVDTDLMDDELKITFEDKGDSQLMYIVRYITNENLSITDKISKVKMMVTIYNHFDTKKLKESENEVDVEFLNAKSFNRLVNKVKDRIITIPQNSKDVDKFRDKEHRRLQDDVY